MDNLILSKKKAEVSVYDAPQCEEIVFGPQRVICASETEVVGEEDGEW